MLQGLSCLQGLQALSLQFVKPLVFKGAVITIDKSRFSFPGNGCKKMVSLNYFRKDDRKVFQQFGQTIPW